MKFQATSCPVCGETFLNTEARDIHQRECDRELEVRLAERYRIIKPVFDKYFGKVEP